MSDSLAGRDIICLSNHFWDERWFRKQEFMSRFARANRILFVEPSISMVRGAEEHLRPYATNRHLRARVEPRIENVHILKPPRGLPKWSDPRVERVNYAWYGRVIARAARRLGMRDPVAWVYRPSFLHSLRTLPHSHLVFDLIDDLTAYEVEGSARFDFVEGMVTELARRSDLLVVTAATLLERYGPLAARAELVPNGFDAAVFSPERDLPEPDSLASVPGPRLGFIGTLFTFLDFDLIEAVARAHADKSVVLVGPVEATAQAAVDRLVAMPNVHHLGAVPQAEVPAYVAGFDACLNPFLTGRAADSISPLKVFEYLAMGKPVVSVRMKALEMEQAARAVTFADGHDDFCAKVGEVLRPDAATRAGERRAAVEPYSWEHLFDRLDRACADALAR